MGRWIDRAEGVDGPELDREERQRRPAGENAGSWGSKVSSNGASADAGDPAESKRPRGGLMSYEQLYALWERQNWRAHELDFSVDRDHWLVSPAESQQHTAFSIGSFYVGEERVTADLAPFLLAAPSGEVEAFLATQLVDEMRHAVFFDRWASEVMGLESGSFRARLHEIEDRMLGPWRFLFDDSLRDIADRIKAKPDDLELFVEGIVTYHMVTEGVLAMPGQRIMIEYTEDHDLYPGFNKGFRLVEQDEHRHIAFGVRFLKDVCDERPEMKGVVLRRLEELLPKAAEVFCPPEADDPSDFFSYGHHSSQIYGFAYQALKRRMAAIGIEIPPPEELMPGPGGLRRARRAAGARCGARLDGLIASDGRSAASTGASPTAGVVARMRSGGVVVSAVAVFPAVAVVVAATSGAGLARRRGDASRERRHDSGVANSFVLVFKADLLKVGANSVSRAVGLSRARPRSS